LSDLTGHQPRGAEQQHRGDASRYKRGPFHEQFSSSKCYNTFKGSIPTDEGLGRDAVSR
jgi:hypothetical protein